MRQYMSWTKIQKQNGKKIFGNIKKFITDVWYWIDYFFLMRIDSIVIILDYLAMFSMYLYTG